ncbi:hypothetical protein V6N12_017125 [Hibiscus sabdariffa]|uniref:t-SNARE coiled-coil homology domain-containing protein n=1 Tax=Hibiscus sabdariffa TaxID=183260 RepID=A0ABR2BDR4_9ROSI
MDSCELPRGINLGRNIESGGAPLNSGELCLQEFFVKADVEFHCYDISYGLNHWSRTMFCLFQIQEIDIQYEKLGKLLKNLQDAHEETRLVTQGPAMKAIKQRMEKDVAEVGRIAHFVKGKIDELDRDNLANREKPRCGKGTSVDRSRAATTLAMKKKLKDKMAEFQILRERIQKEYREVVERRVFTVTGTRPDEETIERLIETGDSEQIFQKAIQEQGRGEYSLLIPSQEGTVTVCELLVHLQIMNTVCEIQERYDAARDLERMLLDLQQVFMDMAVLVEGQGDMLDNIETQVLNAVDHVQSTRATLETARKTQKSNRKWKGYAILLLVIIVIIVLAVFRPWEKEKVKQA